MEIYDNRCAICGETRRKYLQVHHLNKDPNCNSLDNLMLLCIFCHAEVFHPEKYDEMVEWWGINLKSKLND